MSPFIRLIINTAVCTGLILGFRYFSEKLRSRIPEKRLACFQLLFIGCAPLPVGLLLDSLIMAIPYTALIMFVFSCAALIGWGWAAWKMYGEVKNSLRVILIQNIPALIMLILVFIQVIGFGRFWLNTIGAWSQVFFVPVLTLGFSVTSAASTHSLAGFGACLILMLLASFAGCGIRKGKLPKIYFFVAAPLVVWAVFDFYHFIANGLGILDYYGETHTMKELVYGSLVQGICKLAIAAAIFLHGYFKGRERKPIRSITAVTLLLTAAIMGTWIMSMGVLTVTTAQQIYDAMYERMEGYSEEVARYGLLREFYDPQYSRNGYQYEKPDYLEHMIFRSIGYNKTVSHHTGGNYGTEERSTLYRNIPFPMENAVLFYDAEGNLLHSIEDDILYFNYYTKDEWDAGDDSGTGNNYGWIDISEGKGADDYRDDPYLCIRNIYNGTSELYDIVLRATGYFEGTQFIPCVMHYTNRALILDVVESDPQFKTGPTSYSYIISDVDRTGKLHWELQFDRSSEYTRDDLVTIYITHPGMWDYEGKPLVYNNIDYESLAVLAEKLDLAKENSLNYRKNGVFKLNELLMFDKFTGSSFNHEEYEEKGSYTVDFYMVTAIRANPLACAAAVLRNIYIVTGVIALALVLLLRSLIKKHLITPAAEVSAAIEEGWMNVFRRENRSSLWREGENLYSVYDNERDLRRMKDNEITRLGTALEYAKEAEENRRRMTSNIAHELKTPIAVIHGYAEGLKEHIAEEKRDKYLDIILSEAERTDAMVLEMLDLSRLEAGKVKLSRDEFSLGDMAKAVFEKLEMAANAKNLKISFDFYGNTDITADENRIAQVVENFASNAVKYTPAGGSITVKIRRRGGSTDFSVENTCHPLSEEALSKVWDSFYRADGSRSGAGTGLGLAIAKNIVELHGGRCLARNTATGVEFSFVI